MSELEPTRTYSNPTATDILRRMLDERGVEWSATTGAAGTIWTHWDAFNGYRVHAMDNGDGMVEIFGEWDVTPAQAIAATLGPAYEPPVAMHWNGDVLTLTIPRDPSCIRVQRSAEQPCKVYADESKVIAATLGSCNCSDNCTNGERTETCEADETDTWECVCDGMGNYGKRLTIHVMECTECGHVYEHVNGDYEYCPRCGRRRRDVEE